LRIARHIVDAVLLVSALGFAWMSSQYPFTLGAGSPRKIVGLVVYVVLGSVALERGRTRGIRAVAFELALCAVVYLISVAMARSPLGIFGSPA
jgi:uncharacterized membrane protein SirB2